MLSRVLLVVLCVFMNTMSRRGWYFVVELLVGVIVFGLFGVGE